MLAFTATFGGGTGLGLAKIYAYAGEEDLLMRGARLRVTLITDARLSAMTF